MAKNQTCTRKSLKKTTTYKKTTFGDLLFLFRFFFFFFFYVGKNWLQNIPKT
jgi:hypothetical protein